MVACLFAGTYFDDNRNTENLSDGAVFVRNLTQEEIDHPIYAQPFEVYDSFGKDNTKFENGNQDCSMSILGNGTNMEDVWNAYRGDGTTIAIIDTGIDYSHPDFKFADGTSKILDTSRYYFVNGTQITYNQYGVLGTSSYNFLDHASSKNSNGVYELQYHGSNVASTAASAINGNGGCVGIAPNAKILVLKTDMNLSSINEAIKYATTQNVDVINMSLGAYEENNGVSTYLSTAINSAYNKGIIVVAAAGNENTSTHSYPACNTHVIGVGALANKAYSKASFSNFNASNETSSTTNVNVDLSAPGYVYAASETATVNNTTVTNRQHSFTNTQGTSFASPIVAGAACLWKQAHPTGTPDQFESALYDACDDIGTSGWDTTYGHGALNIKKLLFSDSVTPTSVSIKAKDDIVSGKSGDHVQLYTQTQPLNSANKAVTWSSTDSSIASVSDYSGVLTFGSKNGNATLTATSVSNSSAKGTITVTNTTGGCDSGETGGTKSYTYSGASGTYDDWSYTTNKNGGSDPTATRLYAKNQIIFSSSKEFEKVVIHTTINKNSSGKYPDSATTTKGTLSGTFSVGTDKTITIDNFENGIKSFTVTLGGSAGNIEIQSFDITFKGSSLTLSSISVSNNYRSFTQGDTFIKETVTATYSDGSTMDVTSSAAFSGFNSNNVGTQTITVSYGGKQITYTITVSAPLPTNYTVTFNSNGGSGTMSNATTNGNSYVVPACTFTKANYEFDKWALNSATGTKYDVGATISNISSNITLYATWKAKVVNYSVSFNANGGSGTMSNATTNGSSYVTPSCDFSNSGYTFDGWALNSSTGTKYDVGATISNISSDITLYATWKADSSSGGGDEYKYYTGDYYTPITESQISDGGTTLITALKDLIQPKTAFGYSNIWTFNENYDKYPSNYDGTDPLTGNAYPTTNNTSKRGKMWDMYSDQTWTGSSQRAGSYNTIGDSYNREHSMPKSWFGGSDSNQPGTDPNHLFNTDGQVNNYRSNYAFGEVVSNISFNGYTFSGKKATGFGILGKNSSGDTVFEPDDAYKGDFARAQMYMATAYYDWNLAQDSNGAKCFSHSDGVSTMKSYYVNLLTKWSAEDPVSQKEIDRNNAVYNSTQKNRNPFIDHPTWANKIWGGTLYTWNGKTSGDETINVDEVSLDKNSLELSVGASATLTATVSPNNATNKNVTWESSDSSVATVANGKVTGIEAGTATITVKTEDGEKTATCNVTVKSSGSTGGGDSNTYKLVTSTSELVEGSKYVFASASSNAAYLTKIITTTNGNNLPQTDSTYTISSNSLTIDENVLTFTLGKSDNNYTFKTDNYPGNTQYYLDPTNTTGSNYLKTSATLTNFGKFSISFSSSAAVITSTGKSSRNIIRYNPSSKIFSCYSSGQSPVYLFKQEASSSIPVTGVSLNESSATVVMGSALTLSATVEPINATNKNVTWSSSDETIATVLNGIVTPVAVGGPVTITATTEDGNKTATCTVIVEAPAPISVTGVSLNESNVSVSIGSTLTLTATIEPSNATNKNVTWSSSDESVATVSDGVVTSKAVGSATITVTTVDGGFTANCSITVSTAPVITYQLEADQETVPYMSGTNHQVSVGVKLYQYSNGVKGSQVDSSTGSVDTSVLGPAKISYTYQSVTYETSVKVTNKDAKIGSIPDVKVSGENFSATMPDNWSSVGCGKYAQDNAPYLLKMDTTGDYFEYLPKNFSSNSKTINANVTLKMIGGATSSSFTVYALVKDGSGTIVTSSNIKSTISISGKQNDVKTNLNCTLNNSNGDTIYGIRYVFTKGSNVGVSCAEITFNGVQGDATSQEQAIAWSNYFIKLTGGGEFDGPCKLGTPEAKKAALQQVWGELKSEYVYMVEGSKTAFCSTDATETIAEAVQHYRYIVNTYGLEDFAEVPQVSNSNKLIPISDSEPFIIGVIAMVGLAAIGGYFVYKRRREE